MIILQKSDFTGRYQIPRAIASDGILQDTIDNFEKEFLKFDIDKIIDNEYKNIEKF